MNIKAMSVMVVHAGKSETPIPPEVYELDGAVVRFKQGYNLTKDEVIAVNYNVDIEGFAPDTMRLETSPNLAVYNGCYLLINQLEGQA